ncbi:MAG TPA: ATP-binding cassette domain-containing protein, partial [Thermoanaerobacterales bacterium]|nr:ATP-binding cassette domain-containing protein [Thermoanaerobacterales bacterium]
MTNSSAILDVKNLSVNYGDFRALTDVSLSIKKGSIVSIIGSNGAGKSTLLNTIMGVNKPESGGISFLGEKIDDLETNKIVSKGLTMLPEGSRVFPRMTVKENLLMGAFPADARKNVASQLERIYSIFPVLEEKRNQQATFLSGGQRQMLALGRAL